MAVSSRNLFISLLTCGSLAAIIIACGTDDSKFKDGPLENPTFGDGGFGEGGNDPNGDLYKNDPPPPWCGPADGNQPPPITGTEACPDDKNKPGCGCNRVGEEAACWTGLRKHRNLGVCKDGRTKCVAKNETLNVWGPCEGQILPVPDGKGAEACSCFSVGVWNIANTSPCLRNDGASNYYSYSTVLENGQITYCGGPDGKPIPPAGTAPPGVWSPNNLKVDCAGKFDLIFRIRKGNINFPKSSDCILGESAITADYKEANVVQNLPDLPTWAGKDPACAKAWEETPQNASPGYGEMIVKGQTVRCDAIGGEDFVFHRVEFCPRTCRDPANAGNPECVACQLAGKGEF